MNISQVIEKDYPTVSMNEDMANVAHLLTPGAYLVVLDKGLKVVGLITHCDLPKKASGKIKNYNISKTPVSPEYKITEVLNLMTNSGSDTLPVYDNNVFIGVICNKDITQNLIDQIARYKLLFQQVIHDLRNPIANIIGLNGLLQQKVQKAENIELLVMAKESGIHALDILSELLFTQKKENDQSVVEITDLNAFIEDSLTDLKGVLSAKQIELICELPNEEFSYLIDKLHLKRTIQNLASNAIKFSYPKSKIHISSNISGKTYTLKIQDKGVGIPLKKQCFIFDQFTHASRPGTNGEVSTGLGLYFAKVCIERLKGKIWFDSIEGQGTTFFIEFKA